MQNDLKPTDYRLLQSPLRPLSFRLVFQAYFSIVISLSLTLIDAQYENISWNPHALY